MSRLKNDDVWKKGNIVLYFVHFIEFPLLTSEPSHHTVSGLYRPTSETPLERHFAGGSIVARFYKLTVKIILLQDVLAKGKDVYQSVLCFQNDQMSLTRNRGVAGLSLTGVPNKYREFCPLK